MTIERRREITKAMVRRLWDEAVQAPHDLASIHDRAEALLDQVNSENPVVNWGRLTDLHALTRSPEAVVEQLHQHRSAWLTELQQYELDPDLWMRHYFQNMVRDFTRMHGPDRGRMFAARLVREGQLAESDVPGEMVE
jgi:hypothetical protein